MPLELKLHSPVGGDPLIYKWPLSENNERGGVDEVLDTIREIAKIKLPGAPMLFDKCDYESYESVRVLCDHYNEIIRQNHDMRRYKQHRDKMRANSKVLKHILHQCYIRSVLSPDRLNQYEPFSPEVYGETSFDLIDLMLKRIRFTDNDTFVDLGSGIGQVVLQVAASVDCKLCYGIEKAEIPSNYAKDMVREFKRFMIFYGLTYSEFQIVKGDFMAQAPQEQVKRAALVFVNNYAFGPQVDHQLKLRFANMKEGAKIVSSKAYCPLNFRITDRNLSDIGAIMTVKELCPEGGTVSWTDKPLTYFTHTIDRTLLEHYFQKLKSGGDTSSSESRKDRRGRVIGLSEDSQSSVSGDLPVKFKEKRKTKSSRRNENLHQRKRLKMLKTPPPASPDTTPLGGRSLKSTAVLSRRKSDGESDDSSMSEHKLTPGPATPTPALSTPALSTPALSTSALSTATIKIKPDRVGVVMKMTAKEPERETGDVREQMMKDDAALAASLASSYRGTTTRGQWAKQVIAMGYQPPKRKSAKHAMKDAEDDYDDDDFQSKPKQRSKPRPKTRIRRRKPKSFTSTSSILSPSMSVNSPMPFSPAPSTPAGLIRGQSPAMHSPYLSSVATTPMVSPPLTAPTLSPILSANSAPPSPEPSLSPIPSISPSLSACSASTISPVRTSSSSLSPRSVPLVIEVSVEEEEEEEVNVEVEMKEVMERKEEMDEEDEVLIVIPTPASNRRARLEAKKVATLNTLDLFHRHAAACTTSEGRRLRSLNDSSMVSPDLPVADKNEALDRLMGCYRLQFESFVDHMASTSYKDNLLKSYEIAQERNTSLKKKIAILEEHIDTLQNEGLAVFTSRLSTVSLIGVKGSRSYRDFVELAKELMSKHTSFSDNITGIQTNLSSIPERKPSEQIRKVSSYIQPPPLAPGSVMLPPIPGMVPPPLPPPQQLPVALHQLSPGGLSLGNGPLAHLRNQSLMSMLPPPPAPVSVVHPAPPIPINVIGRVGPPAMAHMGHPAHHGLIMPPPPIGSVLAPGMLNVLAPPPPAHTPQKHHPRPIEVFDNHLNNVITNALLDGGQDHSHGSVHTSVCKKRPASNSSAESSDSLKIAAMMNGPKYPIPTSTTQIPTLNLYHNYVSRKQSGDHSSAVSLTTPPPVMHAPPPPPPAPATSATPTTTGASVLPSGLKPLLKVNSELVSSHIDAVLDSVATGHDTLTTDSEMFAKSQEKNYRRKRKSKDDYSQHLTPSASASAAAAAILIPVSVSLSPALTPTGVNGSPVKRKRVVNRSPTKAFARAKKERLKPISLVRSNRAESWLINKDELADQAIMLNQCDAREHARLMAAAQTLLSVGTPPQSPHTQASAVVIETTPPVTLAQSIAVPATSAATAAAAATPLATTSSEDRYSGYDKHFKKKFFAQRSIALNNKAVATRTPQQRAILEEKLGKFNEVNNH